MFLRVVAVVILGVFAGLAAAQERPALKTDKEKTSYSIGLDIGGTFRRQSIDLDPKAVAAGIADAFSGAKPALTDDEVKKFLAGVRQQIAAKAQQLDQQLAEKNKKDGEAFLAENKKKKGVVTLPSGLQYKVITEGTGKTPKVSDTVVTNYRGTLINGTEFDSSSKHGEPATFPVNGVIKGWTEALQLMKVGSKWQIFVPSNLAYGPQGVPQLIGPNATLIFEIELLSIK